MYLKVYLKLGEIVQMWIKDLQIAIIEKDAYKLEKVLDSELPEFKDLAEMQKASYLLREALELLFKLKDDTSESMSRIKKNLDFLKSHEDTPKNKLDIKL